MTCRVVKKINGHYYIYEQASRRENGSVKTPSQYIGPASPIDVLRYENRDNIQFTTGIIKIDPAVKTTVDTTFSAFLTNYPTSQSTGFLEGAQAGVTDAVMSKPRKSLKRIVKVFGKMMLSDTFMKDWHEGYDLSYKFAVLEKALKKT
jgi:hypothetical protein